MLALTTPIDAKSYQIKNLGLATDPDDAVSKAFVEQLFNNRSYKDPVRVAVSSNVNVSSPGATLDGVTMVNGDRVALYGQTTGSQNGYYVWNGASTAMTRTLDADSSAEVKSGMTSPVLEGTNADRWIILITDGAITLNTTALSFVVMSNSGQVYTAGNGLQLSAGAFSILLDTNSGLIVGPSGLKVDNSVYFRKFTVLVGNGSATQILVTHNLGNKYPLTALYKESDSNKYLEDITLIDTNSLYLNFGVAPASNSFRFALAG